MAPFLGAATSLVHIDSLVKNGRVVVGRGSCVQLKSVYLLYFLSGLVFHVRSNTLGCSALQFSRIFFVIDWLNWNIFKAYFHLLTMLPSAAFGSQEKNS